MPTALNASFSNDLCRHWFVLSASCLSLQPRSFSWCCSPAFTAAAAAANQNTRAREFSLWNLSDLVKESGTCLQNPKPITPCTLLVCYATTMTEALESRLQKRGIYLLSVTGWLGLIKWALKWGRTRGTMGLRFGTFPVLSDKLHQHPGTGRRWNPQRSAEWHASWKSITEQDNKALCGSVLGMKRLNKSFFVLQLNRYRCGTSAVLLCPVDIHSLYCDCEKYRKVAF